MPGLSGPRSNGNEGVLRIPQSPSITGTSPADCLVSYPGHSWWGSYLSAEVQPVYSTAPADWAIFCLRISSYCVAGRVISERSSTKNTSEAMKYDR